MLFKVGDILERIADCGIKATILEVIGDERYRYRYINKEVGVDKEINIYAVIVENLYKKVGQEQPEFEF